MNTHPWLSIAESQMDVAEIPGSRNNPRIIKYHDATELSAEDEETSWCSSFVNWCLEQVGVKGTRSAAARSWLEWGREPTDEGFEGCVCVLWRGSPNGWQGHVGFLVDWNDDQVCLLGGNQGNKVSRAWFPMDRVLGYRVPKEA
jgi:uncharacterized protein (TIGR02594 family)